MDAFTTYEVDSGASSSDLNGTVLGRTLRFWGRLTSASTAEAYLGVQLTLSRDPVNGEKTLTYRLRSDVTARTATVQGANAIIDLPATPGTWVEVVADLAADFAESWPALGAGDCGLNQVLLVGRTTSTAVVDGLLSFLTFATDPSYDPRTALASVLNPLRLSYPDLLVPVGLEHSLDQHLGQVGGDRFFYNYPAGTSAHMQLPDDVTLRPGRPDQGARRGRRSTTTRSVRRTPADRRDPRRDPRADHRPRAETTSCSPLTRSRSAMPPAGWTWPGTSSSGMRCRPTG